MPLPNVLKAYSLSVDGRGYAGKADLELPTLSVVTEEYGHGGMSADVKVDMGKIAAIDVKFTLYEYSPEILKQWGLVDGSAVALVARGAMMSDAGEVTPVKVSMRGQFHEVGFGTWEGAAKTSMECTVNCRAYSYEVAGETLIEIDAERMIRVINGVDQMAALRGAIGL